MDIKTHLKLIAVQAANQMRIQELQYEAKYNFQKKMTKKNGILKLAIEKLNERERK